MKKSTILVVEDEPMIAMGIERMLNEWGYTVAASVMTGEEAVEAVRNEPPDLILRDIVLAGPMDGIWDSLIICAASGRKALIPFSRRAKRRLLNLRLTWLMVENIFN